MAVSFVNTQQPRIDAWIQPGCRADIAVVSTESWPVDTVVTIGVADAAGVIAVPLLTITPDLATLTATVALTGVQVAARILDEALVGADERLPDDQQAEVYHEQHARQGRRRPQNQHQIKQRQHGHQQLTAPAQRGAQDETAEGRKQAHGDSRRL